MDCILEIRFSNNSRGFLEKMPCWLSKNMETKEMMFCLVANEFHDKNLCPKGYFVCLQDNNYFLPMFNISINIMFQLVTWDAILTIFPYFIEMLSPFSELEGLCFVAHFKHEKSTKKNEKYFC